MSLTSHLITFQDTSHYFDPQLGVSWMDYFKSGTKICDNKKEFYTRWLFLIREDEMELNPSLCWLDSPFGITELVSFLWSLLSGRSGHKWDSGISGTAIPSKLLSSKSWTILQFLRANLDQILLEILPQIRILLLSKKAPAELWQNSVKKRQGLYSAGGEGALWYPVKEPQLLHVMYQSRQQFCRFHLFFFFGSGEIKPKYTVSGLYWRAQK